MVSEADIAEIRRELERLDAAAPPPDGMSVNPFDETQVLLRGHPPYTPFHWIEEPRAVLERLRRLPDGAGPDAVRAAFGQ